MGKTTIFYVMGNTELPNSPYFCSTQKESKTLALYAMVSIAKRQKR